jgi:hypothetical protein
MTVILKSVVVAWLQTLFLNHSCSFRHMNKNSNSSPAVKGEVIWYIPLNSDQSIPLENIFLSFKKRKCKRDLHHSESVMLNLLSWQLLMSWRFISVNFCVSGHFKGGSMNYWNTTVYMNTGGIHSSQHSTNKYHTGWVFLIF